MLCICLRLITTGKTTILKLPHSKFKYDFLLNPSLGVYIQATRRNRHVPEELTLTDLPWSHCYGGLVAIGPLQISGYVFAFDNLNLYSF